MQLKISKTLLAKVCTRIKPINETMIRIKWLTYTFLY